MLTLQAPAKLNWGLRILDRRPDGYHEIETIFLPLRLFDRLEIEAASAGGPVLEVRGAELPLDRSNLVLRAVELACPALDLEPNLRLRLEKNIPVAAGLGGGSSDAAATLLGLETLAGRSLGEARRRELAKALGADVPFFLDPRPALGRGVGEQLEALPAVPEMWWVLVALPFAVSTAEAYKLASRELTLPRPRSSIAALLGTSGFSQSPSNDLETVMTPRHPEIASARRALVDVGATAVGMSGSGPTVYGRFPDRSGAERAARGVKTPPGAATIVVSSPGSASRDWGWGVAKR